MPKPDNVEWLHPKKILERKVERGKIERKDIKEPRFIDDGACSNDVLQSKYLGNCWFISALALISQDDTKLRGDFDPKRDDCNKIDDDKAKRMTVGVYPPLFHYFSRYGIYVMKFFKDGCYRFVVIDDKLPVIKGSDEFVYGRCRDPAELWVSLIEKAYAKLHNCYSALTSGDIA